MEYCKKSFTLIELLIVIVIIGILATALVPRLKGVQYKAKYTAAEKQLQDLRSVILMAQQRTNKTLQEITQNNCSMCGSCMNPSPPAPLYNRADKNMNKLGSGDACRTNRELAVKKIEEAADLGSGMLTYLYADPRGAPFLLDENEGQVGDPCRFDTIRYAGPDGYLDGTTVGTIIDGKTVVLNPGFCPGAY